MSNRHGGRDLVYPWLVPRVVLTLANHLGGRRLWTEACRLKTLQWRPQSELEARALERLRDLLAHAAAEDADVRLHGATVGVLLGPLARRGHARHHPLLPGVGRRRDLG